MSLLRTQLRRTILSKPTALRAPAPLLARSAYTSVPEPTDPLKEFQPDESTPKAQQQSPNVPHTWSTSQNPKPHAQNNARYVLVLLLHLTSDIPVIFVSGMGLLSPLRLELKGWGLLMHRDRFEQTNLDLQPNAPSAMGMVAEDPVRLVNGRKASCDGGEY